MDKWKIKREIKRIKSQISGILLTPFDRARQLLHDNNRPKNLKIQKGKTTEIKKIAIFLIYQPNNFQKSIYLTCQHLKNNNYAVLLISNAAIPIQEKHRLLENCWVVVERPNFGYDFGGYRDGIWLLNYWNIKAEQLIIINDSIWYPVYENDETIKKMEDSPAQFVGAVKIDPPPLSLSHHKRPSFYASFFWHFKNKAIISREFQDFWIQYKLTNNKSKTIKSGERGFCYKIFNSAISHSYIFSRDSFDQILSNTDEVTGIKEILKGTTSANASNNRDLAEAYNHHQSNSASESSIWITKTKQNIKAATEKQNIYSTALSYLINYKLINFIKKANDPANNNALKRLDELIDAGDVEPILETVRKEIKITISQRKPLQR